MLYEVVIKAVLTFDREEVEYIAECCRRHYDAHIRSLEIPGPGAIVNGMKNGLLGGGSEVRHGYTFREIDSLAKAVEYGQRPVIAVELRRRFNEACQKINALTAATNTLFEIFA